LFENFALQQKCASLADKAKDLSLAIVASNFRSGET